MTTEQLLKKIAKLESMNDQLATEISQVDQLMRVVGFAEGLQTIKNAAQEMIANEGNEIGDEIEIEDEEE